MKNAPLDSVFIWSGFQLSYPINLAKMLGRFDLEIVTPDWLSSRRWRGRKFSGITLDHAAELTAIQQENFEEALSRLKTFQNSQIEPC
jgi:hypothetical protein